ncbi:succinyldiaminopimelate transaminase [Rhodococcus pyridinivorans]|uniref:succinyldiaminopimelate transaminase n=1 Tax=Rhodococcus TaxID=1827 RepID=UPI0009040964|nr:MULTISPECIES: succinyldiaminopimelate transaminase [Rhodococcus]MCD2116562.1 succinyldiaminopimelate transaminase [Rhodococcus pyridinivorans]MCZ4625495.1 succinyldiaminopimelate transaminase [Rhodococcus pyridinivorans]MCZ4646705.1 succinyldiaminopimelate transaminase [Rhodococcus pyridinivorans]MDJ0482869.1 succinyldiaminopimelate transaminase [Rhodococcus pyridinivorans]MDV7252742.1 succinyldiaminopimelate transaminase [Rhodococcus pyridinivorans]
MSTRVRRSVAKSLPDFPWDSLTDAKTKAAAHPDGIVNLSVGTPVDPVAPVIREALVSVAEEPGYPTTHGTAELRRAAVGALERRYGITGLDDSAILPAIGTKEMIAWLPSLLGLGADDLVVIPELAYPTYEVGGLLAGARIIRADGLTRLGPEVASLVFVNSPSNPTGKVLGPDHLRKVVDWARSRNAIVVSDECYLGLTWECEALSILHPNVCGGDHTNLLAVHSLSKTSNLASYRAGFVTGDADLVADLLEVRKHSGMMLPLPIQAAMTAALNDDEHENAQREKYRKRREVLLEAVRGAGFTVDHSEAGLYLWATRGEGCRATVDWFADRGILVAPGEFYGPGGVLHVRIALTATDDAIDAAAARLRR